MAGTVLSLNIGTSEPNPAKDVKVTGITKRPVRWAMLRAPGPKHGGLGSGLKGDFIGDRQHHGGDRQAVYAFAREELDWWEERLGRSLASGSFGENLTTAGLAVDDSLIGDRWAVGDEVVLEVTGPRIPCATFRHRMGEQGWLRRFTEVGRSGAYLAVNTGGVVRPGDPMEVVERPSHGITVPLAFRAFAGDLEAADRVVTAHCLAPADEDWLRERISSRTS